MNWQQIKVSIRTSVRAATETEDGRRRLGFHMCTGRVRSTCIVCMFHSTVSLWCGGTADLRRKGEKGRRGRGGEWEATGLDRFQWNRRLGGAGGTCNGKRVERDAVDWRVGWTGSRLLTQKGCCYVGERDGRSRRRRRRG